MNLGFQSGRSLHEGSVIAIINDWSQDTVHRLNELYQERVKAHCDPEEAAAAAALRVLAAAAAAALSPALSTCK